MTDPCPKHPEEALGYCPRCERAETAEETACREYREMTGAPYCDHACALCDERAAWLAGDDRDNG